MRPSLILMLASLCLTVACPKPEDTGSPSTNPDTCPPPEEDQDGDCFAPPEDCDDTNPYVYPGADEVPYDGVDNDCAGDGDLTDWDGDGYDGGRDGDDCNDGNPDIHPGAEETCEDKYNGVDADCDGSEQTYDCDGDGFNGAGAGYDDCNDEDPDAHPGAAEIYYNGVDNACDGMGEEYDQDGDGDDHADYGGTDCDDTDATSYYGAPEQLDDIDHDCNGEPGRMDQADGFAEYLGSNYNDYDYYIGWRADWISDMDGDGLDDMVACGPYWGYCSLDKDSYIQGRCYILPGAGEGESSFFADNQIATITGGAEEYLGYGMAVVDDLDGDGYDEVLAGSPVYTISGGSGAAHLFSGADILHLGNITAADATAAIFGEDYYGADAAVLDDVDGDGKQELITTTYDITGALKLHIWSGADALNGNLSTDMALAGLSAGGYGGSTVGGGDFDGDGLADLISGSDGFTWVLDVSGKFYVMEGRNGRQYIIPGDDIAKGGAFTSSDVPVISGQESEGIGWRNGWTHDVDGDGYDEVLASGWYSDAGEEQGGVVYVIPGQDAVNGGTAASLAMFTIQGSVEFGRGTAAERPADVDGDGRGDLVFVHMGDMVSGIKSTNHLWLGADIAAGGTVSADASPYYFASKYQDDLYGWSASFHDYDGDGDDDVLMGSYYPQEGKVWAFESLLGD